MFKMGDFFEVKKSKWVQEIRIYSCDHIRIIEIHGKKSKWAENPSYIAHHPEICVKCWYESE